MNISDKDIPDGYSVVKLEDGWTFNHPGPFWFAGVFKTKEDAIAAAILDSLEPPVENSKTSCMDRNMSKEEYKRRDRAGRITFKEKYYRVGGF